MSNFGIYFVYSRNENRCSHNQIQTTMKSCIFSLILILSSSAYSQEIISGTYNSNLHLAYDDQEQLLTGYFEDNWGHDTKTNRARFSCSFYFQGKVNGSTIDIETFNPGDRKTSTKTGQIKILSDSTLSIQLSEDHEDCLLQRNFAKGPKLLKINEAKNTKQIRFVADSKVHFHSSPNDR